ncbi:Ulp1 family isopeptidase, partial [Bradyrhizobium sp. CCBAU 65884]|uniref:Ulp1 family isopeptidase n=1 Tax=Bradyrhizobium sp. CCBAU 65884 TaxID=722477 RepID=UPI0023065656
CLSRTLAAKRQPPFAGRLHDPALDEEARALHSTVLTALNGLRKSKGVVLAKKEDRDVHRADAELIEWYKDQLTREGLTGNVAARCLGRLSRTLAAKRQPPFAGRLRDPALDEEARALHPTVLTALNGLRKSKGVVHCDVYRADAELIEWYKDQVCGRTSVGTASSYASCLQRLSCALVAKRQPPFAGRLHDPALDEEAKALNPLVLTALNGLRKSNGVVLAKKEDRDVHRADAALIDVQQQPLAEPPRFASQRPSEVVSPIELPSSRKKQRVDISRQGPSGLSLGREEWLGDNHILADFTLLQQELQRDNPDLAGRIRFVNPLIAHQLREGADDDMLRALQRVLYDCNGNDTADFLFLPVNDASATSRGTHWSLLLVDRRDRQRWMTYHYDSFGEHNHNVAALLAARLNAGQRPASIGQQQNGYDCGVFVVDGTRELVRRLAEEAQPNLWNLDELVADRAQLQWRLSAAPANARANDPAYQAGPSTRSVDSAEFWRKVDQAGQPAADSWNTANFWQG